MNINLMSSMCSERDFRQIKSNFLRGEIGSKSLESFKRVFFFPQRALECNIPAITFLKKWIDLQFVGLEMKNANIKNVM